MGVNTIRTPAQNMASDIASSCMVEEASKVLEIVGQRERRDPEHDRQRQLQRTARRAIRRLRPPREPGAENDRGADEKSMEDDHDFLFTIMSVSTPGR